MKIKQLKQEHIDILSDLKSGKIKFAVSVDHRGEIVICDVRKSVADKKEGYNISLHIGRYICEESAYLVFTNKDCDYANYSKFAYTRKEAVKIAHEILNNRIESFHDSRDDGVNRVLANAKSIGIQLSKKQILFLHSKDVSNTKTKIQELRKKLKELQAK